MSPGADRPAQPGQPGRPDVHDIANSMLALYGPHDDHDHGDQGDGGADDPGDRGDDDHAEAAGLYSPYRRQPLFPVDPESYAAMQAATQRNTDRYLHLGLVPVDCRRCGAKVQVKKLAPGYTAVQWDSASMQQCAHFAEEREHGQDSSRTRGCPNMTKSIRHAVAEGHLEEVSSAPLPGDIID